jgi:hypothetical protein
MISTTIPRHKLSIVLPGNYNSAENIIRLLRLKQKAERLLTSGSSGWLLSEPKKPGSMQQTYKI